MSGGVVYWGEKTHEANDWGGKENKTLLWEKIDKRAGGKMT